MNRRDSIKKLMAASGTLIALPSWAEGWTAEDVQSTIPSFTADQSETLAAVVDTIIPQGNSIGAISVGVDKFLQKLLADCYETEVQSNVKTQLAALEKSAMTLHGKAFGACTQQQREAMLLAMDGTQQTPQNDFFKLIKSETIRGFNTSREVMVNYLRFRQVPGHYYGCVDVNA